MNLWEQIWCVLSEEMSFETFTPIWSHVNRNEKKNGKNSKFQISQFFQQLWERPFLGVCMIFWEWIWSVLSEEMSLNLFLPYGHMLTKTKKIRKKFKILKKKWSGDMMDRYLSPKFGVNPLDGFRESDVYGRTTTPTPTTTDDRRRTTDNRMTTVALLCSSTKQS